GLDLPAELLRADLLEEAGDEVPGVVHEHIDAAEPLHGSLRGGLSVGGVCDVELDDEQVVGLAQHAPYPVGVASGGHYGVAGGQGSLGDVHTHAAAGAGDEPNLLFRHVLKTSVGDQRPGVACCPWKQASVRCGSL